MFVCREVSIGPWWPVSVSKMLIAIDNPSYLDIVAKHTASLDGSNYLGLV
jgi:hypothetical protein